jgi:dehydrogenase/reductase SDR family protein 4
MEIPRRLTGKVAVVTAATAGIGLGIAERLAQEGAKVFLCSRRQQNVDETVDALRAKGLEVKGMVCHVGNTEHRKALIQCAVQEFGQLDILVSNAAVNPTAGPLVDTPPDAIDKILDINIKAALLLVQAAVPHMKRGGKIVLISSVTAFQPPAPIAMYAVSKTALLGLTKGLAAELGPEGITVNCVAPGIVPTKFSAALVADKELERSQIESTHLKRLGSTQDIAAAVAYLVSDDASYVTGETLVVAGGMNSHL